MFSLVSQASRKIEKLRLVTYARIPFRLPEFVAVQ